MMRCWLLALVLLLRCLLDTWDIGYYMLPCLIAMLAWDALGKSLRRPPLWRWRAS